MTIKINPNDKGNPAGKLADTEVHFTDGPLAGLKVIGFLDLGTSRRQGSQRCVSGAELLGQRRASQLCASAADRRRHSGHEIRESYGWRVTVDSMSSLAAD